MPLFDTQEDIDHDVVLPPSWAFGILYGGYTSAAKTLERVGLLRNAGIPIDAYWVDSWFWNRTGKGPAGYLNFEPDTEWFPDPEGFFAGLDAHGVRAGVWIWDRILREGNEAVFDDFESKGFFRETSVMRERWHTNGTSKCGWIDFANPSAARNFAESLRPLFSMGLDFLKLDAEAQLPYVKAAFEATQAFGSHTKGRGFVLARPQRDGFPTVKRYPAIWTGDSIVAWDESEFSEKDDWSVGGLRQQVEIVADPANGLYQWPFVGNETGGFAQGVSTDELYIRWCQFSCFNPLTLIFGAPMTKGSNFPLEYSAAAQENLRRYARLKLQLFPYIYSYAALTRLTGRKVIRGNGMHLDQYHFGDEFLVAPVLEPGVTERSVFLPRGPWIDYWTGEHYDSPLGQSIPVQAPLDRLPLFVRGGAIIPMREEADSILRGTNDPLILDVYPDVKSLFYLIEDDGISNDYLADRMARTTIQCTESSDGRANRRIRLSLHSTGDFNGFRPTRTIYAMIHGIDVVHELHSSEDILLPASSVAELRNGGAGYWIDAARSVLWLKFHGNTVRGVEVSVDC